MLGPHIHIRASNSHMENANDRLATQERPCILCRKRKIKCDKIRPCSQCQRSGQLCSYDGSIDLLQNDSRATPDAAREVIELRARLEQLEQHMSAVLQRVDLSSTSRTDGHVSDAQVQGIAPHEAVPSTTGGPSTQKTDLLQTKQNQLGGLIFKDGYCAYLNLDFWAYHFEEVNRFITVTNRHSQCVGRFGRPARSAPVRHRCSIEPMAERCSFWVANRLDELGGYPIGANTGSK